MAKTDKTQQEVTLMEKTQLGIIHGADGAVFAIFVGDVEVE